MEGGIVEGGIAEGGIAGCGISLQYHLLLWWAGLIKVREKYHIYIYQWNCRIIKEICIKYNITCSRKREKEKKKKKEEKEKRKEEEKKEKKRNNMFSPWNSW